MSEQMTTLQGRIPTDLKHKLAVKLAEEQVTATELLTRAAQQFVDQGRWWPREERDVRGH